MLGVKGNNTIVTYGPTYTTIVNAFFNRFVQEVLQEAKHKGRVCTKANKSLRLLNWLPQIVPYGLLLTRDYNRYAKRLVRNCSTRMKALSLLVIVGYGTTLLIKGYGENFSNTYFC
ncbi:hypothetical protein P8452_27986 [Trifolium repens]|nr:hypothetical protein P8452_27986 [Trifolium repens]